MKLKDEIIIQAKNYYNWLSEKTHIKELDREWIEITVPYLDRHNDYLQIYLKKEEDKYFITDDNYIITDLLHSGCSLEGKRQDLLKTTISGFGIHLDGTNLSVTTSIEKFPLKIHNLIQAMLAVNDLFYCSPSHTSSLFYEDVSNWMDQSNIRYTPKVKFSGKSGYDHMFDFIVPKSKDSPERIIQILSNPKKETAFLLLQKWADTRDTRPIDSKLFALLNDSDHKVSVSVINALENYELTPVLWSRRDKVQKDLAA